jgi:O-antigen/teichoic acid export membrane protein
MKRWWEILPLSRYLNNGVTGEDRERIIRGTVHSFLIQGISIVLVFLSNLWLVRSSDPDAYGLYVHVFNWISILSIVVMGGRDDLVLAQLPKYIHAGQWAWVSKLAYTANRWLLGAAIVVCGLFIGIISLLPIKTLSEHRPLFLLAAAAVYFSAALALNQMILQALNYIRLSQLVEKIVKPLLLLACIGLFRACWPSPANRPVLFDSRNLVILGAIVLGFCCVGVVVLVYRKLAAHTHGETVIEQPGVKLSGKVWAFFFVSLLYLLSTKVTMLIMPGFMSPAAIGLFNICYRFADLLMFPFFLMHTVLPQLFARHAITGIGYTQSLFTESNKLMSLLNLPLLLMNIFLGKFFLSWFGAGYESGYTALICISLAQSLFGFFGPANTILMMQDREKQSAFCLLLYVIVLLVTNCLLIPIAGINGGAVAILLSSLFYNVLLAVVTYRLSGIISPFLSFLVRPSTAEKQH